MTEKSHMQRLLPDLYDDAGHSTPVRKVDSLMVSSLPVKEKPAYRAIYHTEECSLTELLAVLIGGPRQIQLAYELLRRFGDIHELARTTPSEITSLRGIGKAKAAILKASFELGRRLNVPPSVSTTVKSPDDAAALLIPKMQHLEHEHLVVLLLNTRNCVIGEPIEIYRGSLNTSLIRVGEVLRPALRSNAAAVIVSHNHPSGDPCPSPEDVAITRTLVEAGKLLDVDVLDHLIIGHGRFVSLKAKGLGFG